MQKPPSHSSQLKKQALSKGETVADSATLLSGQFSGIASHLKKINPHMISLHCLHHKPTPKYNSCSHQKLAMGGLCWMTSFVARYNTSGSIFTASVQGDRFLLLGFTAAVSAFQFNEVIVRKRMVINKIIRNNRKD